jgi:hypothetical protein
MQAQDDWTVGLSYFLGLDGNIEVQSVIFMLK